MAQEIEEINNYIITPEDLKTDYKNGDVIKPSELNNTNNFAKELYQNKVEKVNGQGLSTNDYTNADKAKVDSLPENPGDVIASKYTLPDGGIPYEHLSQDVKAKINSSKLYFEETVDINDIINPPAIPVSKTALTGLIQNIINNRSKRIFLKYNSSYIEMNGFVTDQSLLIPVSRSVSTITIILNATQYDIKIDLSVILNWVTVTKGALVNFDYIDRAFRDNVVDVTADNYRGFNCNIKFHATSRIHNVISTINHLKIYNDEQRTTLLYEADGDTITAESITPLTISEKTYYATLTCDEKNYNNQCTLKTYNPVIYGFCGLTDSGDIIIYDSQKHLMPVGTSTSIGAYDVTNSSSETLYAFVAIPPYMSLPSLFTMNGAPINMILKEQHLEGYGLVAFEKYNVYRTSVTYDPSTNLRIKTE